MKNIFWGSLMNFLCILASITAHASTTVEGNVLVESDFHVSYQSKVDVKFVDQRDCIWIGKASINIETHRAEINIESRICSRVEKSVSAKVFGADGFLGLRASCNDLYRNKMGSKICLEGDIQANRLAVIVADKDESSLNHIIE